MIGSDINANYCIIINKAAGLCFQQAIGTEIAIPEISLNTQDVHLRKAGYSNFISFSDNCIPRF
jgi:hypothetical protein